MSKCAVLSCNDELIWISEVLFNVKWRVNQLHMDQPSLNVCRLPVSPCAAGGVYHYSCFTVSSLCLFVCCILSALFTISIKSHRLSCNRTWLLICKLFIWVWTSKQLNTQTLCVGFVFMGSNLTWTWDESYALVLSDQISTQQHTVHGRFWAEVLDQVGKNVVHPFYRVPEPLLWQHMGGPRPY